MSNYNATYVPTSQQKVFHNMQKQKRPKLGRWSIIPEEVEKYCCGNVYQICIIY
jgi:hypothetical protein